LQQLPSNEKEASKNSTVGIQKDFKNPHLFKKNSTLLSSPEESIQD
jgi:hypothetical protein